MFINRGIIKSTRVHLPYLIQVLASTTPRLLNLSPFSLLNHMAPFTGICDVSALVGYQGLMT